MNDIPVVIVGGSLVGLAASVFLSWRGIANIVIEKHPQSLPHPRAMGFTERTLEYFRAVGLGADIPQVAPGVRLRRVKADSLFGSWQGETLWTPGQGSGCENLSPCQGAAIAQDRLEPILRQKAEQLGSSLWLGWEMLNWHQDAHGVQLWVTERNSGERRLIKARYLIGADGAKSAIREQLGITRQGCGELRTVSSVLFSCPAADALLSRGVQQFEISQPGLETFLTSYGEGRWALMRVSDKGLDDEALCRAIPKALGREVPFEVLTTGQWPMAGLIAERYQEGRVFLAGDAAHQLPPTRGGFGANTGIEDAYNLAWKLAWVLKGRSAPALLDSYSAERQPIGALRYQQTFARPDYRRYLKAPLEGVTLFGNEAMELGQLQRSAAILGASSELPAAAHPDTWQGQPGVRAPHLWLADGVSSLDSFTEELTLVFAESRWQDLASTAALKLNIPVHTLVLSEAQAQAFGLVDGSALVRPDGVVGWRCQRMPKDPLAELIGAIKGVAFLR